MKTHKTTLWTVALTIAATLIVVTTTRFLAEPNTAHPDFAKRPPASDAVAEAAIHRPSTSEEKVSRRMPRAVSGEDTGAHGVLFGVIVDSDLTPVADAHVSLMKEQRVGNLFDPTVQASWDVNSSQRLCAETVSDGEGVFVFNADLEGKVVLVAEKNDQRGVVTNLRVPRDQALRVQLRRSTVLRGRVVNQVNGEGIPSATVRGTVLDGPHPGGVLIRAESSSDGSFTLPLPESPQGESLLVNFRVRAPGFAASETMGATVRGHDVTPSYYLVKLLHGRRLTLHLVNRETEEIPSGTKVLAGPRAGALAYLATSDDTGRATITDFPPSKSLRVLVDTMRWVLDTTDKDNVTSTESMSGLAFPIPPTGDAKVTVPVVAAGRLHGKVVDVDSGRTVPNVAVEVGRTWDFTDQSNQSSPRIKVVRADAAGHFSVEGLWRTETFARVRRGTWIHWPHGWSGELVGRDGFPWNAYRTTTLLTQNPDADMTIYARRSGALTGRIVDEDRHPLSNALVVEAPNSRDLRILADDSYKLDHPVRTDGEGRFRMVDLPPIPEFRLRVSHPSATVGTFGPFALSPGDTTKTGDLVLHKGPSITIEVTGPHGPIEGVQVLLTALRGPTNSWGHTVRLETNAEGIATTRSLKASRILHRVLRSPSGLIPVSAPSNPVELVLDGSDRLIFRLAEPHFLAGTLIGPDGKPLSKGEFLAHRTDEGEPSPKPTRRRFGADAFGVFREGVPEGSLWEVDHVVQWILDELGNRREVRYAVKSGSPIEADVPTQVIAGARLVPKK